MVLAGGVLCEGVWEQILGCWGDDLLQEADPEFSWERCKRPWRFPSPFHLLQCEWDMLRLGRVRVTGGVSPLFWEEGSDLMPCLMLVVGTG